VTANPGGGWPDGRTEVVAVIGSPVRHSLSPAIHNAALAAAGLDWAYVAFEVDEDSVPAALQGMRGLGLRGLSVTMPLKGAVARAVDRVTPAAADLQAANTVAVTPDGLLGDNTDGDGFVDAVRRAGWEPAGRACVVIGAGGAARAVVRALGAAGAGEIVVVNRTPDRAAAAAALGGPAGRTGSMADVRGADLVVNATPVGMDGTPGAGGVAVDPGVLHRGQLVADLVYHPLRTPLLAAAAAAGADTADGVGMLVHQAARQFTLWTGLPAPVEAMANAARSALGPA
jgi:shikimate dehydrogenase